MTDTIDLKAEMADTIESVHRLQDMLGSRAAPVASAAAVGLANQIGNRLGALSEQMTARKWAIQCRERENPASEWHDSRTESKVYKSESEAWRRVAELLPKAALQYRVEAK